MRITSNIIQKNALAQMQLHLREISAAQQKVSTGLRIQRASDDPAAASGAMQTRGSLRALEQYRRNVEGATARASAEESVLDQISEVLIRAKELAVSQSSDTATAATRQSTKAEVEQILEFAVSLGNTRFQNEYLFGGQWPDTAPFSATDPSFLAAVDANGNPRAPAGVPRTEISAGRYMEASHDGEQVFLSSGVLTALRDLVTALDDTVDPAGSISAAAGGIDNAFQAVQSLTGETGARANQLQVTAANLDALEINLQTLKSDLEEVDLEKAVTELISRQTAFQSAMLATSKVMGLTLADYLR